MLADITVSTQLPIDIESRHQQHRSTANKKLQHSLLKECYMIAQFLANQYMLSYWLLNKQLLSSESKLARHNRGSGHSQA